MTESRPTPVETEPAGRLDALLSTWLAQPNCLRGTTDSGLDEELLRVLPEHYLARELDTIGAADLADLLFELEAADTSGEVRRHRESLAAFFAWCARWGLNLAPSTESAAPTSAGFRPFTAEELEEAWTEWSSLSPVLADVMLVLAHTGLRWDEARSLTVADTEVDVVRVDKAAGEGSELRPLPAACVRRVPIAPRIRPIVARLTAGRDADELLLTTSLGAPLRRGAVLNRLHWSQTGRGRRLADLRKTAACLWLAEGVDPATVQVWLGPTHVAA